MVIRALIQTLPKMCEVDTSDPNVSEHDPKFPKASSKYYGTFKT